jgi:hypothetical protein
MSTLIEIESAARRLPTEEKQKLLILVAQILRDEGHALPEPRTFSVEEMQAWMDEDEDA